MKNWIHKKVVAMVMAMVMLISGAVALNAQTPEELGMIAVRAYFEADGFYVEWRDEDRSILLTVDFGYELEVEGLEEIVVILFADYNHAYVNGYRVELRDGITLWQYRSFISEYDLDILYEVIYEILIEALMEMLFGSLQQMPMLFPVVEIFEEDGAEVTWDETEGSIHITMDLTEDGLGVVEIILFEDYNHAYVNGVLAELREGITMQYGRPYISFDDYLALFTALLEAAGLTQVMLGLTEEAAQMALYDLDYLEQMILDNTPWASVLYRAYDIDIDYHIGNIRWLIEELVPIQAHRIPGLLPFAEGDSARAMAANYLYALLLDLAWRLEGIGHLGPQDLRVYRMLVDANVRFAHSLENAEENLQLMYFLASHLHPMAVWFYGEFEIDLDAPTETNPMIPGNIVTERIVPGEIAYMRINSFMACMDFDDLTIVPFLHSISEYEHLIIDIRGNSGGWGHYFHENIFRRLINEPLEYIEHQFFADGDYVTAFMEMTLQTTLNIENFVYSAETVSAGIMAAGEFIEMHGMVYINEYDLEHLAWVIYTKTRSIPDDDFSFNGKIWLLIDQNSASASADAALLSINTGFATVVGEPTSGVMGALASYVLLPNTGILWRMDLGYLTDAYGRSFEVYGVAPDVLNFDGMDALETVLTLIEEMAA